MMMRCRELFNTRTLLVALCAAGVVALVVWPAQADNAAAPTASSATTSLRPSWEYSPYRVLVYVKSGAAPSAAPLKLTDFAAELDAERNKQLGGVWKLTVASAPAKLPWDRPSELEHVTADQIAASPSTYDKVMLLGIDATASGTMLTARELDVRTGVWTGTQTSRLVPPARLSVDAIKILWEAFSPLARIEEVAESGVSVSIRGGELFKGAPIQQPSGGDTVARHGWIAWPIIRHFDSHGETIKSGVFIVPSTFLIFDRIEGGLVRGSALTGIVDPLKLQYDGRTEYLALALSSGKDHTTELAIRARGTGGKPLGDLEILVRSGSREPARPFGRTDANGVVKIESPKAALYLVYVRSGNDLLARVPIVPGLEPKLTLEVDDNGRRPDAGRFVASLHASLLDVIAQKSMLLIRANKEFASHENENLEKTIAALKSLPTSEAFIAAMDDGKKQLKSAADASDAAAAAWLEKQLAEIKPIATTNLLNAQQLAALDAALKSAQK